MSNQDKLKSGYWSIATQKHLKEFTTYSSNLDEVDNLNIAGKAGRFLGIIRGNKAINNIKKLEKMANSVGITKSELHCIILPKIEKASNKQVEIVKDSTDEITGIEEYIFTNQNVLEITGQLFENQNPSELERIAVETMDQTKKVPYLESELIQILAQRGFKEDNINLSFAVQNQFKLIQKVNKTKSREPIISNEYVWGPNHKKIALAISNIDFGKKQSLKDVVEIIQNSQGYPVEKLPPIDQDLMLLAKKTGMINPASIISNRGIQKEFAFSPNMLEPLSYNDDILDDVKLLLASIRFGENYTLYSRITDPVKFLESLIQYGDIGPHDANATDYTLLEKKGIVRVVQKEKHTYRGIRKGYCLELIRKDIAEEALKVIKSPDYNITLDSHITNFDSVIDAGKFISAEETRVKLGEAPEHVKEAEDYLSRVLRDELL